MSPTRSGRGSGSRLPGSALAFRAFVRKEAYHILRDRKTLAVLLLMPLVQVLLFGFAIRTDVEHVRLAFVDPTPDVRTLDLRARFAGNPLFDVTAVVPTMAELEPLVQRGDVQQAVVPGPRFAERIHRGEGARVLLVTDASEPNAGSAMQAYATAVIEGWVEELGAASGAAVAPAVRIVPEIRMRFNPTLESVHHFVPGLIAFVLTIVAALMTAISLTREKERGTMEALLVSPLRPWQIVAGKLLPYLALGFADVLLVVAAARLVFGVPVRGSPLLLLAESLLFIVTSLAVGVLISTRADTQRVAMLAALAGLLLPTMLLSGFIFPVESMPVWLQWASDIVPAKWFLIVVRGIMLQGIGLEHLWRETAILAAMTAALLFLGAKNLRMRLE